MIKNILIILLLITSTRIYSSNFFVNDNPLFSDSGTVWKKDCDDFKECKLVFKDNFKDNSNKWPLVNDLKNGAAEISAVGGMHMQTFSKMDFAQWIKLDMEQNEDFGIEANFEFIKGAFDGYYGLVWGVKDWDNYQYFNINAQGYYNYGIRFEGLNIVNSGNLFSTSINKGKNNTNKLKVKKVGKKIFLTINGEIMESYEYKPISGKRFGFIIQDSKLELNANNLIIQKEDNTAGKYASDKKDESFKGNGSGFIISNKGFVVTNYHVVDNSETVVVEIHDENGKKSYNAEVVQKDKNADLAILKIKDKEFVEQKTPIPFTLSTSTSDVGTQVFTLGYPMALTAMGKDVKFTDGKISAKTGYDGDINCYQITVPVQPGNSGGPLFDNDGKLIGIINATIRGAENVTYAIKVSNLRNLIELLSETIEINPNNEIKNMSIEDKIKLLSKYTVIIKTK